MNSNFTFNDEPIKQVTAGTVYIIKDGRVALYLGKTEKNMHCFYVFTSINYHYVGSKSVNGHYRAISQISSVYEYNSTIALINTMMDNTAVPNCFLKLKGLPVIYSVFEGVDISHVWEDWYRKSITACKEKIPNIAYIATSEIQNDYLPVKSKDLTVGKVYITGFSNLGKQMEGWGCTYLYCGRDEKTKEYLWLFVGSCKAMVKDPYGPINVRRYHGLDRTKANKKVYTPVYYKDLQNLIIDLDETYLKYLI